MSLRFVLQQVQAVVASVKEWWTKGAGGSPLVTHKSNCVSLPCPLIQVDPFENFHAVSSSIGRCDIPLTRADTVVMVSLCQTRDCGCFRLLACLVFRGCCSAVPFRKHKVGAHFVPGSKDRILHENRTVKHPGGVRSEDSG